MIKKLLLPTDGSDASERAGEEAISIASLYGSEIIVLYVIDTHQLKSIRQRDLRKKFTKELQEEGEHIVEKFKNKIEEKRCSGECENVNLRTLIKKGIPEKVILETAEELSIDHIVMGKSGKNALEKFILGSTTERVARKAKVPVDIIP